MNQSLPLLGIGNSQNNPSKQYTNASYYLSYMVFAMNSWHIYKIKSEIYQCSLKYVSIHDVGIATLWRLQSIQWKAANEGGFWATLSSREALVNHKSSCIERPYALCSYLNETKRGFGRMQPSSHTRLKTDPKLWKVTFAEHHLHTFMLERVPFPLTNS